ncbi:MAG: nucleotide sugar dehydrogenase [Thaumarchaeota archaeon]|nr:nucleotide sugar dehydrogenase [Nitrososphaerota archaeon]
MKEQTLLKIALVSSILGLAILFAVARPGDAGQVDISSIDGTMKGNQVKILGTVQDMHNAGEVQILDVSQPSSITVFVSGQPPLKKGDMVVVKPTVPMGTSEETIIPILESASGLKVERDFYYVYSPERISVGQAVKDIEANYPTILAGAGQKSAFHGEQLYSLIAKKGVKVLTSLKAAEAEKIFEGIYRDVNIALANELAMVCESLGIDFSEVREAANSQPYSHIHKTGIGVGGACIPVYPWFVIGMSKNIGFVPELTKSARMLNQSMPEYSVDRALSMIGNSRGRTTVLGLSFRGGIADRRLSQTYDIVKALLKRGCKVAVHDPFAGEDPNLPKEVILTNDLGKALKGSSLVILSTDHPEYRSLTEKEIKKYEPKIEALFDGRAMLNPSSFSRIRYHAIGREAVPASKKLEQTA